MASSAAEADGALAARVAGARQNGGQPAGAMTDRQKFAVLRAARRIWVVGAIHSDVGRLKRLHARLWPRIELCDRIVYTGNMIGRAPAARETLDALLNFRLHVLARPHSETDDVVYLRGSQEEMWQKLLQLQFANDPRGVLEWMIGQGVGATLESYGVPVEDARREASAGTVSLTRWTGRLRQAIHAQSGHHEIFAALRRAAYTEEGTLLIVNAGIDPKRPLETQTDSFWWSSAGFDEIDAPYGQFKRVVRGYDPCHGGFKETEYALTVDGGCGFDGQLMAACLSLEGDILDVVEA